MACGRSGVAATVGLPARRTRGAVAGCVRGGVTGEPGNLAGPGLGPGTGHRGPTAGGHHGSGAASAAVAGGGRTRAPCAGARGGAKWVADRGGLLRSAASGVGGTDPGGVRVGAGAALGRREGAAGAGVALAGTPTGRGY